MIEILAESPLLLLFIVAAVGYPLGRLKVGNARIGVASVLFAGLLIGALDPRLRLPEIMYQLGLVLFIYTVGLASGPAFVASFRRKGLRDNVLVAGGLALAWIVAWGVHLVLGLDAPMAAGLFSGALTNTPALASGIETLKATLSAQEFARVGPLPVVGYSIAYPVGVMGVILAIWIAERVWRTDYVREAAELKELGATSQDILIRTIEVTQMEVLGETLESVVRRHGWTAIFTRIETPDGVEMAYPDVVLSYGTHLTLVTTSPEELDRIEATLGRPGERELDLDRSDIDSRRFFVSNKSVAGRTLRELQLPQHERGIVTRLRRGDVEIFPHAGTTLELGDRVMVVAPRDRLQAIGDRLGDSYRALSEIDIATFSLGLFLGILAGLLPIPLPGGVTLHLGLAGGPLVAGLVLGTIGFTGRLVWTLPWSANLTIRQLGLVLFLAGIGTQAGFPFAETIRRPEGLALFAGGAVITIATALSVLWVGHRLLKIPMSLLTGMVSAMHTQPAVLGYAVEQTRNDLPNLGYATVFPTATILKILGVQLVLALF